MKRYRKECILLGLQICLFYIFPLTAGPTDAMGMVFLIIVGTFAIACFLGMLSGLKWKWAWPVLAALLFLPTVPVYYNISAAVHALWYLVISGIGLLFGWFIRKLFKMK